MKNCFILYFWLCMGYTYSMNVQHREIRPLPINYSLNSCTEDALKISITERLSQAISNETDPFSLKPFHLFYRSFLWSTTQRQLYWMELLNSSGLDEGGVQSLLETSMNDCPMPFDEFTGVTSTPSLNYTALCLNDPVVLETLERIEWKGWYLNIWFDVLLLLVFLLLLSPFLYLLKPISWMSMLSTVGIKLVIGCFLFLIIRLWVLPSSDDQQILMDCYLESVVRQFKSR